MTATCRVVCDGCGRSVEDDTLRSQELRDALQTEQDWVWTEYQGRVFDVCPSPGCADVVAVLAGAR